MSWSETLIAVNSNPSTPLNKLIETVKTDTDGVGNKVDNVSTLLASTKSSVGDVKTDTESIIKKSDSNAALVTNNKAAIDALSSKLTTLQNTLNTVSSNTSAPIPTGGRVVFPYNGGNYTWTVPSGVRTIYLTACGAGGSGSVTYNTTGVNGIAGGNTVVSGLVTLYGGKGGKYVSNGDNSTDTGGAAGGAGGGKGISPYSDSPATDGIGGEGCSGGGSLGGGGAYLGSSGYITPGGRCYIPGLNGDGCGGTQTKPGNGIYGSGGGHNSHSTGSSVVYHPGGGGGGAAVLKKAYSVTPGQTLSISIGKGGASVTNNNYVSGKGGDGLVIIEW